MGAGSCGTGRNTNTQQIMNKHRQLLSCSFRKFILKSVLSHSAKVCMTGLNDDDDDNNRNNF